MLLMKSYPTQTLPKHVPGLVAPGSFSRAYPAKCAIHPPKMCAPGEPSLSSGYYGGSSPNQHPTPTIEKKTWTMRKKSDFQEVVSQAPKTVTL